MTIASISRESLKSLPLPGATRTYTPVPHNICLDICEQQLNDVGLQVREENISVREDGLVMACQWIVKNGTSASINGIEPQVIVLNGNTRKHKLRVGFGIRAIVCLNGMFAAERSIGRKHTRYILRDLEELIQDAIHDSLGWVEDYVAFLYALRGFMPKREDVNSILVASAEQKIISSSAIMKVLSIYKKPTYSEYGENSLHTLHSAFTETLRSANPFTLPQRTIKLDKLFQELLFDGKLNLN